jgi:quinohemoprotein ethanol dehydrogenase
MKDREGKLSLVPRGSSRFLAGGGLVAVLAALLCGAAAPVPSAANVDGATIAGYEQDGRQWPSNGGGYSEERFSPLTQINKSNVAKLGFAWAGDLNSQLGIEATPIEVGGVLYISGQASQVFAFDAVTGRQLWHYQPTLHLPQSTSLCCDIVNRGVAVWKGRVYVGVIDGRLVALDAATGKVDWTVDTLEGRKGAYSITGAPRVVKGKVLIGNGGADFGARGFVTAYDAETGQKAWRFWTVPEGPDATPENDDVAKAMSTWPKDPIWTGVGGGTAWDAMSYDPKLNLLYVGTGNGGPWKNQRPNDHTDNLYVASIVALNPDTGRMVWHYQETPGDRFDFTATNQMILTDLKWKGVTRQVIMQAPKNGFFYILDRKTGELLSAERYGAATWADHIDMKTGRPVLTEQTDFQKQDRLFYPYGNGAHDWQSLSYNPRTGLVYIPAQDLPFLRGPDSGRYMWDLGIPADKLKTLLAGQPSIENGGFLRAWDPIRSRLVWQKKISSSWNGGTLATATDLVLQGAQDGNLTVYDAKTGAVLKTIFTGSGMIAPPITYSVDGVQYVAIAGGLGGASRGFMADTSAARIYQNQGRVMVFKLGGGAVPTPPKRPTPKGPLTVDQSTLPPADPQLMARGAAIYGRCMFCHGRSGSTPVVSDLGNVRQFGLEGFRAIVMGGALTNRGMPNFTGRLSDDDVKALYEYISHGAHNKAGEVEHFY